MGSVTNILFSATDNFSPKLNTMRSSGRAFSADLDTLNKKLNNITDKKYNIKLDFDAAKRNLKEAQKAFEQFGDTAEEAASKAAAKSKYSEAAQSYEKIRREYSQTTKEIRETEKALSNLMDTESRGNNKASKGGGGISLGGLASGLAAGGLTSMLGGTITDGITAYAGSAMTKSDADMLSSVLSGITGGAAGGAMLGSVVPGIGNVAGAVIGSTVGLVTGVVGGVTKQFENEDEAFKSEVSNTYQMRAQEREDNLKSGSAIASEREGYHTSFSTMLFSDEKADKLIFTLKSYADSTPFGMTDLTKASKTMLSFGVEENSLMGSLRSIGDVSQGNKERFDSLTLAFSQVKAAGKITGQDLLQFVNAGFNPLNEIAKVTGESMETLRKRMSDGAVSFAEVEAAFKAATSEGGQFYNAMEKQSHTFAGLSSTLGDAYADLNAAMGEGYNKVRGIGMQEQASFIGSDTGSSMMAAYSAIGRNEARMENLKEEYGREAYNMVMGDSRSQAKASMFFEKNSPQTAKTLQALSGDYTSAAKAEDGAKLDSIIAEIKTVAENAFKSDTNTLSEVDRQIDLLSAIRENTALMADSWKSQYRFDNETSKGRMSTTLEMGKSDPKARLRSQIEGKGTNLSKLYDSPKSESALPDVVNPFKAPTSSSGSTRIPFLPARAMGVPYVPRDNYPILAHEGEQLLTANEARAQKQGQSGGITVSVTGNEFVVRSEKDIQGIASAIAAELSKTQMIR